jgi:cell pole-organizing protein PopZ
MSDARDGSKDPSMDDILASIRKIISDDEARAQMTTQRPSGPQAPGQTARLSVVPPSEPLRPDLQSRSAGQDDVLLLTEDLMEDAKVPQRPAEIVVPPAPQPRSETVRPSEPARVAEPAAVVHVPEPPAPSGVTLGADSPLIDGLAAGAAADAFSRLNLAVQDSVPTPAAADPGPLVGGQAQTIEDLVKEMLRPMLKDWLDRNLPGIVERYVEREIVRLTRR